MRTFLLVVAATAVLLVPASALAGAAQRRNPYANLFTAQLDGVQPQTPIAFRVPTPSSFGPPARTVVCGMEVVQGNANIDPKMLQHPPANAPKGSIRIMPAPACQK